MFNATKFIVAGAIVALVGSFQLSGALVQPDDAPQPPAAASTASSPKVDVTAAPERSVRSDIVPGVDLVTEEVEPGAYRVLSDGVRDLAGQVQYVAVSADGDVYLELGSYRNWSVVRLGAPGASRTLGGRGPWQLLATSDGVRVMRGPGDVRALDGARWTATELTDYEKCVNSFGRPVGSDGKCWYFGGDEAAFDSIDPDGTRTEVTHAEIGLEPDQFADHLEVAPDGTVWAMLLREAGSGHALNLEGLLAYDGTRWSVIPYDGDGLGGRDWFDMAVGSDGVVWISSTSGPGSDQAVILNWDGESWASHPYESRRNGGLPLPIVPWPNGIVWFGDAARWDGSTLDVVEPTVRWFASDPVVTLMDGSFWTVIDQQLYVITPDAVTASE
jgi:hypothetical protein